MGVLLVSGAIEFLQPWLLPALFAAGIPIAIHLAMRSRPRRQVFPALQFLLESHPVANRAHRLKHLLLMLCRMAVIALLVLLLMEPLYVPPGAEAAATTGTAEGPISVVLAFDDSASMGYRYQGRTRIDAALEAARQLMDLHGRFPPGSEFVVLSASSGLPSAFTADPMAIESALRTVRVRDHSRDARLLLDRAVAALSRAQHRRREIYLFTDLA